MSVSRDHEPTDSAVTSGWQPIATAPRDGTPIDLWADGQRWAHHHWSERRQAWGQGGWRRDRRSGHVCRTTTIRTDLKPTHWLALPAPPSSEEQVVVTDPGTK